MTECVICGKEIKEGKEKQLSCKELNSGHEESCECYFDVGSGCYNKIKKKQKVVK